MQLHIWQPVKLRGGGRADEKQVFKLITYGRAWFADISHLFKIYGVLFFCRPNSFAIYTANRIYDVVADSSGEMHMWIGALSPKKFSLGDDDILGTCLMKGQHHSRDYPPSQDNLGRE